MNNLNEYAIRWWIKDEKWLYSEKEGRDVGVPETVDRIMKRFYGLKPEDRTYLIEGYFLCPKVDDFDGANQLEGELKRFKSKEKSISPRQINVTREIVDNYCKEYNLEESIQKFEIKLFKY